LSGWPIATDSLVKRWRRGCTCGLRFVERQEKG